MDNNGYLDKKEAHKFIKEVCAPGSGLSKDTKKLMKLIDTDNDNKLTYDEVLNFLSENVLK